MRIMIVDDSKAFREAVRHLLRKKPDCEVVAEAENGKKAVEIAKNEKLDLVLMDIEMPVMNGIDATKLMLYQNSSLKVIAVSSYQEKLYLDDIISAGFKAFVNKNNVFENLEDAISNVYSGKLHVPKDLLLGGNYSSA